MSKYFYCYSYPLKEFFKKNGLSYITAAQNISATRKKITETCQTHKPYKGFNFRFANETIQN